MAKKRGRPFKNPPLVTIGSSVSATVIADTIECGSTQQITTPTGPPFTIKSLEGGNVSAHIGLLKKLELSANPSITQGNSSNSGEKTINRETNTCTDPIEINQPRTKSIAEEKLSSSWVKLFAGNRSAENGMTLSYIAPEVVDGQFAVNLDKEEVENETEKWKKALIVYVIGETPAMAKKRGRPFKNPPLVTIGSSVSATVIADTIECGNTQQISTPTGPPFTTKSLEGGNVSAHTDPSGRHFQQPIEFEWKPEFCSECLRIGHDCVKQKQLGNPVQHQKYKRSRVVPMWVPKQRQKDPVMSEQNEDSGNQNKGKAVIQSNTEGGWIQVKAKGSSSGVKAAVPQHYQAPVDIITTNGFQGLTEEEQRNIKANPPDLGGNKLNPPDLGGNKLTQ
ncbi:hypothetical protein A4A49_28088 [Nicotiana attenuata]|uniref:Uncharacterized protein n=1 Tax=Nicotiana attenuata TaxID=49451 RepID=A0A1J6K7T7_NICAT|nr:hypothetical protein A4A49_28088 [Nicotiana attenuata]